MVNRMLKWKTLVPMVFMMAFGWAFPAWAGVPTEKVKETADKIIAIVGDPSLKDPAKAAQRRERIRKTVDDLCDWEEMSRRSLGRHWAQRTEQEKKEFVHLFPGIALHFVDVGSLEQLPEKVNKLPFFLLGALRPVSSERPA